MVTGERERERKEGTVDINMMISSYVDSKK